MIKDPFVIFGAYAALCGVAAVAIGAATIWGEPAPEPDKAPYFATCTWPDGGTPIQESVQHFEVVGTFTTLTKTDGSRVFINNAPCVIEER